MRFVLAVSDGFDDGAPIEAGSVTTVLTRPFFGFADEPDCVTDTISARPAITPTAALVRPGRRRRGVLRSPRALADEEDP